VQIIRRGRRFVEFDLGDARMLALHDGHVDVPATRLRERSGRPLAALPEVVPTVGGRLRLSVNAFLVEVRGHRTLIDTGAADSWEPSMGAVLAALAEAGIERDGIADVLITHPHTDHIGGLLAPGGGDAFPRLQRVVVGAGDEGIFGGALARFRDRVSAVAQPRELSPRVTAEPAPGHTPGHTAYRVRAAGAVVVFWGDALHVPSIQFALPDLTWELDADRDAARLSRRRLLEELVAPGHYVAGAHLDWPGVGVVTREGDGFAFTPVP
jgi:glyoxylase-like metal-dependent hydrolase (beta-lactamase superfamily II)